MSLEKFRAYRIHSEGGRTVSRFEDLVLDDLDPGEVVVRVRWSGINYKDALAATGAGKVVRRFPLVGGIDLAGVVSASGDPRFREGDEVVCTSYDLGVSHDGGYAECARVPADWVVPLPRGLSLHETMALGTAGYTAALAIHLMEQNGLRPGSGKVLVNGATGGVGALAIDMLAGLGHHVVALTGKESEHGFLRHLGAAEVLPRSAVETGKRPLEKPLWAAAVDNLGGEPLAWLLSTMQQDGLIASVGNAASVELHTTVFPFILRGVRILGVDSGYTAMATRRRIWERLGTDLRPRRLAEIARTVAFDELPGLFEGYIRGEARGRVVVKIS